MRLEIDAATGDVDLATRLARTERARIRSNAGDVTLRVGDRSFFELEATTATGAVKALGIELETLREEGDTTWLRRGSGGGAAIRTVSGKGTVVRPYDASRLDLVLGKRSR